MDKKQDSPTVDRFLAAISPAFDAIGKFDTPNSEAFGPAGPKIGRAVGRFGKQARAAVAEVPPEVMLAAMSAPRKIQTVPRQAPTVEPEAPMVSKQPAVKEPFLSPRAKDVITATGEYLATIPEQVAREARHLRFHSTMAYYSARQKAREIMRSERLAGILSKFTNGAKISAEGDKPNSKVLARAVAAGLVLTAVTSFAMVGGSSKSIAEAPIPDTGTLFQFEVEMRQVNPSASGPIQDWPSDTFLELAQASLSATLGPVGAAEHIEHAMAVFEACSVHPDPCAVHTPGLTLDAKNGRYLLRSPVQSQLLEGPALAYEEKGEIFLYGGEARDILEAAANESGVTLPESGSATTDHSFLGVDALTGQGLGL